LKISLLISEEEKEEIAKPKDSTPIKIRDALIKCIIGLDANIITSRNLIEA